MLNFYSFILFFLACSLNLWWPIIKMMIKSCFRGENKPATLETQRTCLAKRQCVCRMVCFSILSCWAGGNTGGWRPVGTPLFWRCSGCKVIVPNQYGLESKFWKPEICAQIQVIVKLLVLSYSSVLPPEKHYDHFLLRGRENQSYYTFNLTPECFCVLVSEEERIAVVLIHWSLTRWS